MTTTSSPVVLDVNEQEFVTAVLERSRTVPVVVDFWAPWCGPCRVLGPVLERLAAEMNGAFILAKVNVDQNQRLASRFRVQGIPAVKAFRDGKVTDQFEGALPESRVREWLRKVIPSNADRLADEAARLEAVDPAAAATLYRQALEADPAHSRSLLGLGRVLVLQGDPHAVDALQKVPIGAPEYSTAQALLDLLPLIAAVEDTSNAEADQLQSQWRDASLAARERNWQAALDHLLRIVQRNRGWRDGAARRAMLAIFALLGDDPLVLRYRQQLASVLFG